MRCRNSSPRVSRSCCGELLPAQQLDAVFDQLGIDPLAERPGVPHGQLAGQLQRIVEHLPGQPDAGPLNRETCHHPAHQPGHPDHEKLVQVGREDGQEPHPLQQRDRLIFRELEHPLVEPEPAFLPVQVALGRKAGLIVRPRPFGSFGGGKTHLADAHAFHCPRTGLIRKRKILTTFCRTKGGAAPRRCAWSGHGVAGDSRPGLEGLDAQGYMYRRGAHRNVDGNEGGQPLMRKGDPQFARRYPACTSSAGSCRYPRSAARIARFPPARASPTAAGPGVVDRHAAERVGSGLIQPPGWSASTWSRRRRLPDTRTGCTPGERHW